MSATFIIGVMESADRMLYMSTLKHTKSFIANHAPAFANDVKGITRAKAMKEWIANTKSKALEELHGDDNE